MIKLTVWVDEEAGETVHSRIMEMFGVYAVAKGEPPHMASPAQGELALVNDCQGERWPQAHGDAGGFVRAHLAQNGMGTCHYCGADKYACNGIHGTAQTAIVDRGQ